MELNMFDKNTWYDSDGKPLFKPKEIAKKISNGLADIIEDTPKGRKKMPVVADSERYALYSDFLDGFMHILRTKQDEHYEERGFTMEKDEFSVNRGRVFDKIIERRKGSSGGGRVWGFIRKSDGEHKGVPVRCGDIMKAATWAQPAKHPRGNIFNKDPWVGCGIHGPSYL